MVDRKSYINTGPFPRSFRFLISTKTIHPANQMMVPVEKLKRRRRSLPLMNNIMLKYICEHLMASGESSITSASSGGNGGFAMMGPGPFVH